MASCAVFTNLKLIMFRFGENYSLNFDANQIFFT